MRKDFRKHNFRRTRRFCRSHFVLQRSSNSLTSLGAKLKKVTAGWSVVQRVRIIPYAWAIFLCGAAFFCPPAKADKLRITPEISAAADQIFSGDLEAGRQAALRLQQEQPEHPTRDLLAAETLCAHIWA